MPFAAVIRERRNSYRQRCCVAAVAFLPGSVRSEQDTKLSVAIVTVILSYGRESNCTVKQTSELLILVHITIQKSLTLPEIQPEELVV